MEDAFIGMDALKREHAAQVAAFRRWAQARDWATFHASHYDWWAFPVNRASRYGNRYRLTPEAVKALQADTAFLALWREGVSLAESDLPGGPPIAPLSKQAGQGRGGRPSA